MRVGLTRVDGEGTQGRGPARQFRAPAEDGLDPQHDGHHQADQQQALPGCLLSLPIPAEDHRCHAGGDAEQEREALGKQDAPPVGGDVARQKERWSRGELEADVRAEGDRQRRNPAEESDDQAKRNLSRVPEVGDAEEHRRRRGYPDRTRAVTDVELDRIDDDLQLVPEHQWIVEAMAIERIDESNPQLPLDHEEESEHDQGRMEHHPLQLRPENGVHQDEKDHHRGGDPGRRPG